jgi:hypothetical protein
VNSKTLHRVVVLLFVMALPAGAALASDVLLPNYFVAGTPIRAAEVNANFQAIKGASDDNYVEILALQDRMTAQEAKTASRVGAYTVGALDFQPTVTGSTNVVRVFDSFGADTANGRIGAAIHPPNGSTPTKLTCWFTAPGTAFSTNQVRATVWRVSNTVGSQAMASLDMPELLITGSTPAPLSTATFTGGFHDVVGTDYFRYLVELEFQGVAWPTMKVYGCTVEYTTAP